MEKIYPRIKMLKWFKVQFVISYTFLHEGSKLSKTQDKNITKTLETRVQV